MTKTEHLLACLCEEAGEIIQATTKALRFGLDGSYFDGTRNDNAIKREIYDLIGIVRLLEDHGIFPVLSLNNCDAIESKKHKVLKNMQIAVKLGTLEPES